MKASRVLSQGQRLPVPAFWRLFLHPFLRDSRWRPALVVGFVCAGLGAWLGAGFWQEDIEALAQLRQEVATLQAAPAAASATASAAPRSAASAPVSATLATAQTAPPDEVAGASAARWTGRWPWLQQGLLAHGLQVLALRPGPIELVEGRLEQTLWLEVQGHWRDWRAFEQQLHREAPWWTVSQWQVVPTGEAGEVRMQWHWRWAWPDAGSQDSAGHETPGRWRPAQPSDATQVFARADALEAGASVSRASALPASAPAFEPLGPDPSTWPVQALRLHGVWWQDGVPHAVLGQGLNLLRVAAGQRVGAEGHRVLRVGPDEVVLQPAQPGGEPLHLVLKGAR